LRDTRGGDGRFREKLATGAGGAKMNYEWLWVAVILLNASATITLWQRAARRPEKLKKKFRNLLWRSKPITPKHERPTPLREDEWGLHKGKGWDQFFSDFGDFANVVNSWLADPEFNQNNPWRLQELPKLELSALWYGDGPTFGRRYAVFHNQVRVGEIEIKPDWNYSPQNPEVTVHVEIHWARLLGGRIRDFLTEIAYRVTEYRQGTPAYFETNRQIDLAFMDVLWETQEISEFGMDNEPGYGSIEVQFNGLATYYLDERPRFREKAKQHTGRTKQASR
jgi:hypothetical protein